MAATASVLLIGGSALYGAAAQRKAGEANAEIAGINARIADMQADDALRRGEKDEKRHRLDVKKFIGSQRVALAAQGIEVDSGTALELQEETAGLGELDALTIRNNAAREAWGYRVQAQDATYRGEIALQNSKMQANATLLEGASRIGSMYYKANK